MPLNFDNFRSLIGLAALFFIGWILSTNRRNIPFRTLGSAVAIQIFIVVLVLFVPTLRNALSSVSVFMETLVKATQAGTEFAFGHLAGADAPYEETKPENNFVLALQILPLMIVISALSAVFWHWGILNRICIGLGKIFKSTLGISGPASLGTAASVFLGMVEAPLVIRPYLEKMSRADIFLVMTAAMATIAGTMMAVLITLMKPSVPNAAAHVIIAAFMSAPGAIAFARLIYPPDKELGKIKEQPAPKLYSSTMDAFSRGVQDGTNVFVSVVSMIIVSIAIITLLNIGLETWAPNIGGTPLTVGRILGALLAPLMYIIGIPWDEANTAGSLLGTRIALNEFLAFLQLAQLPEDALSERSRTIMIYALCGFANLMALAIMVSALSAMSPTRRPDFMALGYKCLTAGIMTNLSNAALIGFLTV